MDETWEAPSGRQSAFESGWWVHHLSLAIAVWVGLPIFGAAYALLPPSSAARGIALIGIASFGFAAFVTAWGSLFGYYYDARALRRSGAPWVPDWRWWATSHLLLWPIVAPLYVVRRYRRVGMVLPAVGNRGIR